ncbi:MAG TPA: two-component sensor histidine kinase [Cytophagales bacterium]|nr:two-component sensor histidine kinase [Cytophagales bacterium]HAA19528.1 two-component sensor histidine kinase [Cytophagales bacterium]HAP59597.1 two-component sensor histidine kinase [Cytophagales bacterium]
MDSSNEGVLLIATSAVILVCFAIAVLAVMLIYRRRKLEHKQEVQELNERFTQELLRSQLEIQQQTMEHIGREIHDNVGSQLTLASLYTNQLPTNEEEEPSVGEQIGQIIDQALVDLRGLSKSLTAGHAMQQTSLRDLLQQECQKLNRANDCTVSFGGTAPTAPGSLEVNSFVLRIVQEFIQNSFKHAQCTEIDVRLDPHSGGMRLQLSDNGIGFDPESLPENHGIGLRNMQSRAEIIRADFSLHSKEGEGTQLILTIPPLSANA